MKTIFNLILLVVVLLFASCSGQKDNTDNFDINKSTRKEDGQVKASERIDLENKGVGPIQDVMLAEEIDLDRAKEGEVLFNQYCVICHKVNDKFIGPAMKGVLDRRSPEWVMNMILEPAKMLKEDPLAKDLFMEFNGSPMSDMGLSEAQARAVLEYFRTL